MKKLSDSLSVLPGVGPKSAEKFLKIGLETVEDILIYYPFRYEDFQEKSIFDLSDGEKVLLTGEVVTPANVQYYGYKRNRLRFSIKKDEVVVSVSFFNQPYLAEKVEIGTSIAIWGKWDKAKATLTGMKILSQSVDDLQPVYHVAQGVTQKSVEKLVKSAFDLGYLELLTENLPVAILEKYRLMPRKEAVYAMHFPKDLSDYKQALRRVKFEELFYFQMNLQDVKSRNRLARDGAIIQYDDKLVENEIQRLPFKLTEAQQLALSEILSDMNSSAHMNRLLQGDVGSGKTVVAGLAMFASYTAGFQSALMVPTEILAEQHCESLRELFPDLSIVLLTGGMKAAPRKAALAAIASGEVDLIVGTHALIQDGVEFHNLGLVITDEQHRFGVNQRRELREKGENPDVLMMTATPIPRTLAITAFGEMDVSVINQLPAGRKPIVTRWVKHEQMSTVLEWLNKEVARGAQVYVISPLIEESESLDLKNAIALEEELATYFTGRAQVSLLHGKMKADEKEAVMQDFKEKRTDILVSTTVIEVGVNVPNATVMMIMDADRFGLSQLHQLRGRVGRGHKQSYAILVANPKTESGKQRMKIMTETTDGFVLAEEDLKMRGSGEIFGTKQSGIPEFKVANLVDDFAILEEARRTAAAITSEKNWRHNPDRAFLVENLKEKEELD